MANSFRTVNLPGIAASILSLVSIFLPWWGITSGIFGISANTVMYGFFGPPATRDQLLTNNFTSIMTAYSPVILALALITTALVFLGSFARSLRPLAVGLVLAIGTLAGYSALVSLAISQNCQGNGCIRGPVGNDYLFNLFVNWGFQSGYYLFLGATVLSIIALVYHQIQRTSSK